MTYTIEFEEGQLERLLGHLDQAKSSYAVIANEAIDAGDEFSVEDQRARLNSTEEIRETILDQFDPSEDEPVDYYMNKQT